MTHATILGTDATHEEMLEIAQKLDELEKEHDEGELFPDSFMQEFTDFDTWDAFKRRLEATPKRLRDEFVARTTRFSCHLEMEAMALELLVARKFTCH
jgi:hypothetical protein